MKNPLSQNEDFEVMLTSYLLGELGDGDVKKVELALSHNAELQELVKELETSIGLLRQTIDSDLNLQDPAVEVPTKLQDERRQNLMDSLRQTDEANEAKRGTSNRRMPWFVPMGIAASLILLLSAYSFMLQVRSPMHDAVGAVERMIVLSDEVQAHTTEMSKKFNFGLDPQVEAKKNQPLEHPSAKLSVPEETVDYFAMKMPVQEENREKLPEQKKLESLSALSLSRRSQRASDNGITAWFGSSNESLDRKLQDGDFGVDPLAAEMDSKRRSGSIRLRSAPQNSEYLSERIEGLTTRYGVYQSADTKLSVADDLVAPITGLPSIQLESEPLPRLKSLQESMESVIRNTTVHFDDNDGLKPDATEGRGTNEALVKNWDKEEALRENKENNRWGFQAPALQDHSMLPAVAEAKPRSPRGPERSVERNQGLGALENRGLDALQSGVYVRPGKLSPTETIQSGLATDLYGETMSAGDSLDIIHPEPAKNVFFAEEAQGMPTPIATEESDAPPVELQLEPMLAYSLDDLSEAENINESFGRSRGGIARGQGGGGYGGMVGGGMGGGLGSGVNESFGDTDHDLPFGFVQQDHDFSNKSQNLDVDLSELSAGRQLATVPADEGASNRDAQYGLPAAEGVLFREFETVRGDAGGFSANGRGFSTLSDASGGVANSSKLIADRNPMLWNEPAEDKRINRYYRGRFLEEQQLTEQPEVQSLSQLSSGTEPMLGKAFLGQAVAEVEDNLKRIDEIEVPEGKLEPLTAREKNVSESVMMAGRFEEDFLKTELSTPHSPPSSGARPKVQRESRKAAPDAFLGRGNSANETTPIAKRKAKAAKPAAASNVDHRAEQVTLLESTSTFSLNVSDVSFKVTKAALEQGQLPDRESIRSEQFINAFDYRDPSPFSNQPIGFYSEQVRHPFAHHRDVLRFSLQTAASGRVSDRPMHLTILLDNSGSMERNDRREILKQALQVLSQKLTPQDKISVVSFARTARLWIDGIQGGSSEPLLEKVNNLTPQGGTNIEEALNAAYEVATEHYVENGINRVVLLTDGAANLGNIDPETLKLKVETERRRGIAFDCFGVGWDGLNDPLLEVLSRNGDGRYGFLNDPSDASIEFADQLAGALNVAASDVKVQVEFNPGRVQNWRQIGYARHQLTREQFRDNTVDAAEIAAAESGNALYVIEPKENGSGPIGSVRVRYRIPHTNQYREKEWTVPYRASIPATEDGSPAMKLALVSGLFAEWLNGNPHAGNISLDALQDLYRGVPEAFGTDPRPHDLARMFEQVRSIGGF